MFKREADTIETNYSRLQMLNQEWQALQGSLLVRHAPPAVAGAFGAARRAGDAGLHCGALATGADVEAILKRHTPAAA